MNWTALYTFGCEVYGLLVPQRNVTVTAAASVSIPSLSSSSQDGIRIVPSFYDGKFGIIQYIFGSIVLHIGLVALEGSTLSLLSKISPLGSSRSVGMNVGSLVTIIGLLSKLLADSNIYFVDISQRLIHADVINAILVPTIICSLILNYYVKKNFFFLV
jgi:hypothetical protein